MATKQLEVRVAALEKKVERLKSQLARRSHAVRPWWEQIAGTFTRDKLYEKAMELGRAERRADGHGSSSARRRHKDGRPRHRSP